MSHRALWFESHLLAERSGRRARQACERLGGEVHELILRAGDRLASASPALAQQFYRRAADVWQVLGARDFERWLRLGEGMATASPPAREAALAFFSVPAKAAAAAGIERLEVWCMVGNRLAAVSRKLGATFFESTSTVVHRVEPTVLEQWVEQALRLHGTAGWRGEFLAQGFLAAAPHVLPVLGPEEFRVWAELGVILQPALRESQFFTTLPPGLAVLRAGERRSLLLAAAAVAAVDRSAASTLYQQLPQAVRRLQGAARAKLLEVIGAAGPAAPQALKTLVPVAGALVADLPGTFRLAALDLARKVASIFPRGALALLRSLPSAYESARHDAVESWVARGLEIAADNAEAADAYFALESRTSVRVLQASSTAATLSDVQGLLRKYVHMLSGQSVSIRSTDAFQLRPPLEEFPLENEIALPLTIDLFPTHEENCAVFNFLAAQLAGRRELGTYDAAPAKEKGGLVAFLRDPEQPTLLEDLFLLAEGFRVATAMARLYPGLARQQQRLAVRLLERADPAEVPSQGALLDAVLARLLAGSGPLPRPAWLDSLIAVIAPCVVVLARAEATVDDALAVAQMLAAQLSPGERRGLPGMGELALDRTIAEAMMDPYLEDEASPTVASPERGNRQDTPVPAWLPEKRLELEATDEPGAGASSPLSPEVLQKLLEAGVNLRLQQGPGNDVEGLGLYISDLLGKVPSEQLEELRRLLGETPRSERSERRRWLERRADGVSFYYDEWDYHIGDYRQRWCRLLELPLEGDSGEFFGRALADHAGLIPELRRHFQRIRPEMYRVIRGLEDGEDFDLNAVVDARVDRRARRPPSAKVYVARQREERDVATLFLIDMSASTDEPLQPPGGSDDPKTFAGPGRRPSPQRIIDVTKEALVLMAQALDEIGDAYAIYGFSGHGRDNVEFYLVKAFTEALSPAVKGRIGAIEPKRSTRMGTALRHAVEKMQGVTSRSRHIILLSDGFPQDFDYGQDRRSNVYGLRDTTVALRECEAAGITPFCITVDKAGHDYLREMCDESRYMVIEDITALPRELPKIYQRVVGV